MGRRIRMEGRTRMETAAQPERGRPWLLALLIVLLFPVIGFGIGVAVEAKYQGDLTATIEEEIGRPLTEAELAEAQISDICQDPEFQSGPVCVDLGIAAATRLLAIVSGVVGLILLAVIAFTASRAKRDRASLVRLFTPALYIVLVAIALLVILDG